MAAELSFLREGTSSESLRETAYLPRSPANAHRLLDSIENLEHGCGTQHDLVED